MITESDHPLIDTAIAKLIDHLPPNVRVTDILTAEEHRAMKRAFQSVRDHHGELHRTTPRVPPEGDAAAEVVNSRSRKNEA